MEARIKKLETQVVRLARRSRKVATGLVTPIPVSGGSFGDDVKGDIFHYMFAGGGTISKLAFALLDKPKGTINVIVEVFDDVGSETRGFNITRILTTSDTEIKIKPYDRLRVTLTTSSEHPVKGIWISYYWLPDVADASVKRFLIDELDKVDE